jgi:hypothetical protein
MTVSEVGILAAHEKKIGDVLVHLISRDVVDTGHW